MTKAENSSKSEAGKAGGTKEDKPKKQRKVVQVYVSENAPLELKLYNKIRSKEPVQVHSTRITSGSELLMELALIGMVQVEKTYPGQFEVKGDEKKEGGDDKAPDAVAKKGAAQKSADDQMSSYGIHSS